MVFKKLKELDKTAYLASQSSYGSQKHADKLKQSGFSLDEELSNDRAKVYNDGKQTVISYRGTKPTDTQDLSADKSILLNKYQDHSSFKDAEKLYEKTRAKYGEDILLTGHSLGGTKAIHVSKKYNNKKNIVFNPGSGLNKLETKATKVYNHKNDLISGRVDKSDVLLTDNKNAIDAHKLDNYSHLFD